jgi:hypothetical protein
VSATIESSERDVVAFSNDISYEVNGDFEHEAK